MEIFFFTKQFWRSFFSNRTVLLLQESIRQAPPDYDHTPKEFIGAVEDDISAYMGWYNQFSAFEEESLQPRIPFEKVLTGSSKLSASIGFDVYQSKTQIILTLGLYVGIYDIMQRICCNKAVLNFSSTGEDTWSGTTCFYPQSGIMPKIRFSAYIASTNEKFNAVTGSSLSLFVSGSPVGSEDRLYLGSLLEFISLTWILYHEEAHYWQGHLFYLDEHGAEMIDETEGQLTATNKKLLKVFEWQADRGATVDLINMFFIVKNAIPFELPDQFADKLDLSTYVRIILCSLGTTVLIFQKNKLIHESDSYYPSPHTRLSSIVGIMYSRLMQMGKNCALYNIADENELQEKVLEGLLNGLIDLFYVEGVLTNEVSFEDGIQRVFFEAANPKSLFFFEDFEEVLEFMKAIIRMFETDNEKLYKKWYEEYQEILTQFPMVFEELLPAYKERARS